MKRKSVSPVIAVVLIVALTVAATATVWYITIEYLQPDLDFSLNDGVTLSLVNVEDQDTDQLIDGLTISILSKEKMRIEGIALSQSSTLNWSIDPSVPFEVQSSSSRSVKMSTDPSGTQEIQLDQSFEIQLTTDLGNFSRTFKLKSSGGQTQVSDSKESLRVLIYNDSFYPTAWITPSQSKRLAGLLYSKLNVTGINATFVSATDLPSELSKNPDAWLIITSGLIPETVFNSSDLEESLIEKWYDNGGNIIWTADWPFYYSGRFGGGSTYIGQNGERAFFDISNNMVKATSRTVSETTYGSGIHGDISFTSLRPFSQKELEKNNFTPLAYASHETRSDNYLDPVRILSSDRDGQFMLAFMRYYDDSLVDSAADFITDALYEIADVGAVPQSEFTVTSIDALTKDGNSLSQIAVSGYFGDFPVSVTSANLTFNGVNLNLSFSTTGSFSKNSKGTIIFDASGHDELLGQSVELEFIPSIGTYNLNRTEVARTIPTDLTFPVYVYYNDKKRGSWIDSQARDYIYQELTGHLTNNSVVYVPIDDSGLSNLVSGTGAGIILLLTIDILPSTVFAGQADSPIEQWVRSGGTLVQPGDVPFYYYYEGQKTKAVSYPGFQNFLEVGQNPYVLYNNTVGEVQTTSAASEILPNLSNHVARRTLPASIFEGNGLEYIAFTNQGENLADYEVKLGNGSFVHMFLDYLSKSKAETYQVGKVMGDYAIHRKSASLNVEEATLLQVIPHDLDSDGKVDALEGLLSANFSGPVLPSQVMVNGSLWHTQSGSLHDGLSTVIFFRDPSSSPLEVGKYSISLTATLQTTLQSNTFAFTVTGSTLKETRVGILLDRAYPNGWTWGNSRSILGYSIKDGLENEGISSLVLKADEISYFLDLAPKGVLIPTSDILPDTIYDGSDNSRLEQWLENGGSLFSMFDWMGYFQGHSNGTVTTIGSVGATNLLDINAIMATSGITITGTDQFNQTFTSYRPINATLLSENGYNVTLFGITSDNHLHDLLIFNAGTFANGTQATGWIAYLHHRPNYDSTAPVVAQMVVTMVTIILTR